MDNVYAAIAKEFGAGSSNYQKNLNRQINNFVQNDFLNVAGAPAQLESRVYFHISNARSLRSPERQRQMKKILANRERTILCVTETWWDDSEVIDLPHGFQHFTDNYVNTNRHPVRDKKGGGGVVILVPPLFQASYVFVNKNPLCECVAVDVDVGTEIIRVNCTYIPPYVSKSNSQSFESVIDTLQSGIGCKGNVVLTGDFNLNPATKIGKQFTAFKNKNALTEITREPTNHTNILLMALTNQRSKVRYNRIGNGMADHSNITFHWNL